MLKQSLLIAIDKCTETINELRRAGNTKLAFRYSVELKNLQIQLKILEELK